MSLIPNDSPGGDLYALPILERWLLFAPRTWGAALVNRAAVKAVAGLGTAGLGASGLGAATLGTATLGTAALGTAALEAGEAGDPFPWPQQEPSKIVIIPTRSCNMRCVYCDFAGEDSPQTTLEAGLACRLVDYFADRLRERGEETLRVHFFGGEPLLARSCLETIVHYVRALCACANLTPWFELTTNGLLDQGIIPFVGDYMDSVVLSLDGLEDLHDYNRRRPDGSGTYAQIAAAIRQLSGYPAELALRMCVTDRSAGVVAQVAERLCGEFEFDLLSFEMLAENETATAHGLRSPDPLTFAAGVLRAEEAARAHGVRVIHGPSEIGRPRLTCCPLGLGTIMLAPEGELTACYLNRRRWEKRGLDLHLGRVDAAQGVLIDEGKLHAIAALLQAKSRCRRCFCRYTCAGGCHIDQTPPGCSLEYDDRCRAIRVVTAGRILRSLGCAEEVDRLLDHPSALRALVDHPDDRLAYWRGPGEESRGSPC